MIPHEQTRPLLSLPSQDTLYLFAITLEGPEPNGEMEAEKLESLSEYTQGIIREGTQVPTTLSGTRGRKVSEMHSPLRVMAGAEQGGRR